MEGVYTWAGWAVRGTQSLSVVFLSLSLSLSEHNSPRSEIAEAVIQSEGEMRDQVIIKIISIH